MSTVATPLRSAEQFFEWVHRPENHSRFFELERGEIVEMPATTKYQGFVCGNIIGILGGFAARRKKGYPCSNDAGLIVERNPDTVRGPDISFYEDEQNAETMDRAYSDQPPRLVVEVISPTDKQSRVMRRISEFLRLGVPLVWLVDPEVRTVTVFRSGKDLFVLDEGDTLTGLDVLPDFQCPIGTFFAPPGQ